MSHNPAVLRSFDLRQTINDLAITRRGNVIAATLADGSVQFLPADDTADEPITVQAHAGVALSFVPDADEHAFLSGGDDGLFCVVEPTISIPTELARRPGQWIDHVAACAATGARAYASGKQVVLFSDDGTPARDPLALPSPAGGLAFAPDGAFLAASHYGGVTLFDLQNDAAPTLLPWKGAHQNLIFSPDSAIVISSLHEGALHGWRVQDKAEMHMHGYQAHVGCMRFTPGGDYLVTSGADQAICWPFTDGGPWNKKPLVLGGTDIRLVRQCAPHPTQPLVAIGYDDGMIVLAPLDGRMEVMIHTPMPPQDRPCITGLVWNGEGDCLFAAQEGGRVLLFTHKSIRKASLG